MSAGVSCSSAHSTSSKSWYTFRWRTSRRRVLQKGLCSSWESIGLCKSTVVHQRHLLLVLILQGFHQFTLAGGKCSKGCTNVSLPSSTQPHNYGTSPIFWMFQCLWIQHHWLRYSIQKSVSFVGKYIPAAWIIWDCFLVKHQKTWLFIDWLVVWTPVKNMISSVGMMTFPTEWEIKVMFQSPPTSWWCLLSLWIINHPPFITIFVGWYNINRQQLGWFMTLLYPHDWVCK